MTKIDPQSAWKARSSIGRRLYCPRISVSAFVQNVRSCPRLSKKLAKSVRFHAI